MFNALRIPSAQHQSARQRPDKRTPAHPRRNPCIQRRARYTRTWLFHNPGLNYFDRLPQPWPKPRSCRNRGRRVCFPVRSVLVPSRPPLKTRCTPCFLWGTFFGDLLFRMRIYRHGERLVHYESHGNTPPYPASTASGCPVQRPNSGLQSPWGFAKELSNASRPNPRSFLLP